MSDGYGGDLHYRCAFDATCVNPDWTEPHGDMLKRVRDWAEKVLELPPNTLKNKKFYHGGNFREGCPPRTSFETVVRNYNEKGMPPSYWGCRLSNPCREFSHRTWTTEITIATRKEREFRVVLVNSHAISQYLGQEPPPPAPSAPNIVQSLVTSRHWRCSIGAEYLTGKPKNIYAGQMDLVRNALLDERRACPIVYVSCAKETATPLVDVAKLAQLLSGTAVVYVAKSPEVDKEAEYIIGEVFGTWNGGIRIYRPGVDLDDPRNAGRHRFFTPPEILRSGTDEVVLQIVRACCRRAPVIKPSDVVSIDEIVSVGRRIRLHELAGSQSSTDKAELEELIAIGDEENQRLRRELEEERLLREIESEESADKIAQCKYEKEQLDRSYRNTFQRLNELELRSETLAKMQNLPVNLEEALQIACALHSDKIEYLDCAAASARKASFGNVEVAWRVIWAMASTLHQMIFDDSQPLDDRDFLSKTGFRLAMCEGKQTQRDGKLMKLRKRTYKGREIDITPHVAYDSGNDCFRAHFATDHENRKLIIGHFGNHLDNWTTKHRRK